MKRILDCFFTVHVQDSKSSQSPGNKSKSGASEAGDSFQDQSIGREDVSLVVRNVFQHPDVKEPLVRTQNSPICLLWNCHIVWPSLTAKLYVLWTAAKPGILLLPGYCEYRASEAND